MRSCAARYPEAGGDSRARRQAVAARTVRESRPRRSASADVRRRRGSASSTATIYTFVHEVNADGVSHRYRAVDVPELDDRWALVLADCAHNLRVRARPPRARARARATAVRPTTTRGFPWRRRPARCGRGRRRRRRCVAARRRGAAVGTHGRRQPDRCDRRDRSGCPRPALAGRTGRDRPPRAGARAPGRTPRRRFATCGPAIARSNRARRSTATRTASRTSAPTSA